MTSQRTLLQKPLRGEVRASTYELGGDKSQSTAVGKCVRLKKEKKSHKFIATPHAKGGICLLTPGLAMQPALPNETLTNEIQKHPEKCL